MKNIKDTYASLANYWAMDQVYDNYRSNSIMQDKMDKNFQLSHVERQKKEESDESIICKTAFHNSELTIEKLISKKEDQNKLKSIVEQHLADYEDNSEITASNIDQLIGDLLDSIN
jgi:hypothetical protein